MVFIIGIVQLFDGSIHFIHLFSHQFDLQISADLSSQRALELRPSGSLIVDSGISAVWNGGVLENGGLYAFTKAGDGTLLLGGTASHSGATIVDSGLLQAGAANLFTSNDSMRIATGAAVDLQSYDQQINHLAGDGELRDTLQAIAAE